MQQRLDKVLASNKELSMMTSSKLLSAGSEASSGGSDDVAQLRTQLTRMLEVHHHELAARDAAIARLQAELAAARAVANVERQQLSKIKVKLDPGAAASSSGEMATQEAS